MSDQSQPLTREEREAMREYVGKATKGQWYVCKTSVVEVMDNGPQIAQFYWEPKMGSSNAHRDNATFCARARTDMPRLLDDLDRAERERDEANARARKAADDLTTYLLQLRTQREQIASLVSERDELRKAVDSECQLAEVNAVIRQRDFEIEEMRGDRKDTNAIIDSLTAERDQARADLAQTQAEAAGMREALEWYDRLRAMPFVRVMDRLSEDEFQRAHEALSTTAGRDLLARYRSMEEALAYYGDSANYVDAGTGETFVLEDGGAIARAAVNPPAKEVTADAQT